MRRNVLHAGHLYLASWGDVDGGRARHGWADPVAACLLHSDARPVHLLSPGADRARAQQGPDTRRRPRWLRHRSQRRLRVGTPMSRWLQIKLAPVFFSKRNKFVIFLRCEFSNTIFIFSVWCFGNLLRMRPAKKTQVFVLIAVQNC